MHPELSRVGCVLNGRGEFAPPDRRRSRGDLPLRAAADSRTPGARGTPAKTRTSLARYDPFYLVCADLNPFPSVLMLSWDGTAPGRTELGPGTHVLTNSGHGDPPAGAAACTSRPTRRPLRFGPKFAAHRPSGDPAVTLEGRLDGLAHPGQRRRPVRRRTRRDHRPS